MKVMLTLAVSLLLANPAAAQRAKSPADATVYVRLVGSVHVEIEEAGITQTGDMEHVEIGTGSGFVISPYGYILTNEHVVNSTERVVRDGMREVRMTLSVSRIDVCFRAEAVTAHGLSSPCYPASVAASDPTLDLAVLFVSGSNFPYVALGDSDALSAGLPVDALGYPFGRDVEVGKIATAPDLVPEVSMTPGALSALRADDAGERRYLQISNNVNPGNSGGPLVNRDGFAVGVIRMRLTNAVGIGFAIPVNQVKEFLESHSLDQLLPARRLSLGAFQSIEGKGLGLRLPEGFVDMSPFRPRVETDARSGDITLRIDRVPSPWNPTQIGQAFIGTQTFEALAMSAREGRLSPPSGNPPLLLGGAMGISADTDQEIRIDYAVLDLVSEKLVARYVGPAEWMAFNEGMLRESLASLQGQRLVGRALVPVEKLEWSTTPPGADGQNALPIPAGWTVAPGDPTPCPGLPQPSTVTAASPVENFTVIVRAAVWSAGTIAPAAAASTCSSRRGSLGGASYISRADWLGVSYVTEGVFARIGPKQIVQLEVLSTDQNNTYARALLAMWLKKVTE